MVFQAGSVTVGNTATVVCTPLGASQILVENQGTASVTLGGPGVTAANGFVIASGALPVAIQATHFSNVEDADDRLYAITPSGTATVSFIQGY